MTKFDKRTIDWIKSTLTNDESASDEEMVQHFMEEGKMTKEEAEKWVKLRSAYSCGFPKHVAVLPRQFACPHCNHRRLDVVIHWQGWLLECSNCGDALSEKDQHAYFMEPSWTVVLTKELGQKLTQTITASELRIQEFLPSKESKAAQEVKGASHGEN